MRNTEAPATSTPSQNHGNRHSTQPIDISQGIDIRHFLITPGLKCTFTNSGLGKFVRSHNNLEQSFFARDPTEELRYGPIIEQLRLKEDRPNKLLNQYHALIYSHRHKPEGLLYSDPRIKDIVDGVHAIQQNRRDAKLDEEKGLHRKMLSEKSTYGLLLTFKVLNMNDNGSTDEPVNLKVYTTMSNTLFYRGHQGGDYVMRYRTPANSSTGDDTAFDGRGNPIWPDSNSIFGSLGVLDDIPLNAKGNFTYCGQVPRPLTQYIYRFSIVLVDVVVIIGTVIAYYRSINSCATHPQLEQILDDPAASRQRIGTLYTLWQETFEQREFPRTLCDDVQKCARVHEFAYLFGLLSRFREDTDALVTSCRPLVEILQQATGWHLFEMVDIEDCKRSKLAEHLLFQEQKFDNILVFEDDRIKVSCSDAAVCSG